MSIAITSRDAVAVPAGAGGFARKRINSGANPGPPSATAILVTGPSTGLAHIVSELFVVSVDGTLGGSLTVSLAFSGVANSPSATSVVLTPAAPTASFDVTPAAVGTLTITASASGYSDGTTEYVLTGVAPTPDMDQWLYKLDPEYVWGASAGNNYLGNEIKPKCNIEFNGDPADADIHGLKLYDPIGTYDGSAGSPSFLLTVTETQIQRGNVTPTYAIVERGTFGSRAAFRHRFDRNEHNDLHKWRSQLTWNGDAQDSPWGTVMWHAFGVYITEGMSQQHPGVWHQVIQYIRGVSSRIRGGALEFWIDGGDGNPNNAWLRYAIMHYRNPNWASGDYTNNNAYIKKIREKQFVNVRAGHWYWIVVQYRMGCGIADPNHGAIYGSVGNWGGQGGTADGLEYFVKIWYAEDDGYPVLGDTEYRGHWGGPHDPAHSDASENILVDGVLTNTRDLLSNQGIYSLPTWTPTTMTGGADPDVRDYVHCGHATWRHQDGMDQIKVLAAFRG